MLMLTNPAIFAVIIENKTYLVLVKLFLKRDGNPVPRTVQMKFLQLIRLVHNESSLI